MTWCRHPIFQPRVMLFAAEKPSSHLGSRWKQIQRGLGKLPGQFRLQWFDTVTGAVSEGGSIEGEKTVLLRSPSSGAVVLYLRSASSSEPSLAAIQDQAQAVGQASIKYAPLMARLRFIAKPYLDKLANSYHAMVLALFTFARAGFALGVGGGWALAYSSSK